MTEPPQPTKPPRDAPAEVPRREGRSKDMPEARALAPTQQGGELPAKAPFEGAAPEREARSPAAGTGRGEPPGDRNGQQPRRQPEEPDEGYLRITVRVDRGRFAIVDSHRVAGPLAQAAAFQGRFAYEVTAAGQLLHAGSIPDLGEYRSFADPNPKTPQQRGHHHTRLDTYEFDVRVPLDRLRAAELQGVTISLYQVKQPDPIGTPARDALVEPLGLSRSGQLREIGRVEGLPPGIVEGVVPQPRDTPGVTARSTATKERSPDRERDESGGGGEGA